MSILPRACSHYRKASMMRAKTLHPRKSTSRCSHREQRRRPPCNRRHTRAIAVRRVDSSRADAQGLTRVRRGGPTGAYPSATAKGRVWAPAAPGPSAPREEGGRTQASPPRAARRGVVGVPGRARAGERRAIVRGTPMHRGGPPASGAAEGLRTGCVRAPVPAGGTLTMVLSSDRTSRVIRTICSRCRCAKTRSSTPFFDQRFIRVEMGCQLPKRVGNPRPLPPCSARYKMTLSTWRWERRTGPRGTGR